jgi:hypothetical protein
VGPRIIELQKRLDEAEVGHIAEAGELVVLVGDVSKVLMDLGMPPILRIPQDPGRVSEVLEAVGTILEQL